MPFIPGPDFGCKGMPMDRVEVDARQRRCDQAMLRPAHGGYPGTPVETTQPTLLSFDEAKAAGQAMYDRWEGREGLLADEMPPFERDDAAWADLARAAWEAVWAKRRGG